MESYREFEDDNNKYQEHISDAKLSLDKDGNVVNRKTKTLIVTPIKVYSDGKYRYSKQLETWNAKSYITNIDSKVILTKELMVKIIMVGLEEGYKKSDVKAATEFAKFFGDPKKREALKQKLMDLTPEQTYEIFSNAIEGSIDDMEVISKSLGITAKSLINKDYATSLYQSSKLAGQYGTDALAMAIVGGISAKVLGKADDVNVPSSGADNVALHQLYKAELRMKQTTSSKFFKVIDGGEMKLGSGPRVAVFDSKTGKLHVGRNAGTHYHLAEAAVGNEAVTPNRFVGGFVDVDKYGTVSFRVQSDTYQPFNDNFKGNLRSMGINLEN